MQQTSRLVAVKGGIYFENAGGAIARVSAEATAFVHRDIHSNVFASVAWTYGEDGSEHIEWLKQYWAGIEPFTKGFYVNNMPSDATPSSVLASYGSNQERMVRDQEQVRSEEPVPVESEREANSDAVGLQSVRTPPRPRPCSRP